MKNKIAKIKELKKQIDYLEELEYFLSHIKDYHELSVLYPVSKTVFLGDYASFKTEQKEIKMSLKLSHEIEKLIEQEKQQLEEKINNAII